MRIQNNMMAMNTQRSLSLSSNQGAKSMAKLSSGFRINSAADDAAGLSISEKMRSQIRGLAQASRNAQDGISMIQTAEGALGETQAILQRMRELAVQAGNDTNTAADRGEIQKEINQLTSEVNRIGNTTEFNTKTLLDGGASAVLQIGSNQAQTFSVAIGNMRAVALGISGTTAEDPAAGASAGGVTDATFTAVSAGALTDNAGSPEYALDVTDAVKASAAISVIDQAVEIVSSERSKLGAMQNRLEHTIKNLDTSAENMQAAESRIRDVDMAKEMMEFTKNNILQQAATAMLAQANQAPQAVLQLLR